MPSNEHLEELYEGSWAEPARNLNETGGTDAELARIYARKVALSLGRNDFCGLRLLEFGAGKGEMVAALRDLGANVCAVEPFGHRYLQQEGFPAVPSLDALPRGAKFDGILAIEVIEHLPSPWKEIAALRQLLKESGWLFVTTPNAAGLNAKLRGSRWREAQKPGHVVFFTPRNLESLLARCGYRCHRRLRWFIGYSSKPLRVWRDYTLQLLRLDGELRYMAFTE